MNRYLLLAGLLGATGVAAGAFGAHALQASVSLERIGIWETAAQYHLIHAAAILALALGSQTGDSRWRLPMMGFTGACCCFRFAVCAGADRHHAPGDDYARGGLLLMLGWLMVAIKALKPAKD